MIRIAILENEKALADALAFIIAKDTEIEVVATFESGEKLLESSEVLFDILLVDLNLGDNRMSGIELIIKFQRFHPEVQYLVLTVYEDDDKVFNALSAGANGYILKSSESLKIIEAIHDLNQGGSPMSPSIARKVTQSFSQANQGIRDIKMMLTQREIEIIEMISKGKLEKEVASDLFISIKTVKNHITNIYHKLHVTTRVEALNKYFGKF